MMYSNLNVKKTIRNCNQKVQGMGIQVFGVVASWLGVQEDFVRIAFLFILNITLSYFFRFLKQSTQRVQYSLLGFVFLGLMLQNWALYVILTGIISYFIIKPLKKRALLVSILLSFGFLVFIHLYRALYDYESWKLDCSVMQMFMTTKIIYFGYHIQNGGDLSFFWYLGYAFFFPGVLIGPTFSVETYVKFVNLSDNYSNIVYSAATVYENILKGLLMSVMTVVLVPRFPTDWFLTNPYVQESSLPVKIIVMSLVGIVYRIKFYTGWSFTQAAVNSSGISYDGKGGYREVDIGSWEYEKEYNPRLKTEWWNASVQKWLRICFYQPVSALYPKSQTIPTLIVFFFSAIWHGVYVTYYLGFFQWALLANISKFFYKASYKFGKWQGTTQLRVLTWLTTNTLMNYIGMLIVMLNIDKGIAFYNSLYWFGTIVFVVVHTFFIVTGWGQRSQKKAALVEGAKRGEGQPTNSQKVKSS